MAARYTIARKKAQELLGQAGVTAAPVPVERLASLLGATIRYEPFEGDLSGMVHRRADGRAVIGINSLQPTVRKRYTIAHELGHLLLHADDEFHVDERNPIGFRTSASSLGTDDKEIEANQFAAELLVPREFISRDVAALLDTSRQHLEDFIEEFATRYQVSVQTMTIRLSKLHLLW